MTRHKRSSRILVIAIVALCGSGAWMSGQLVKQHDDIWSTGTTGSGVFARVCRATEAIGLNCTSAHKAPWAELVIPLPMPSRDLSFHLHKVTVPVAFLGLAYFVFIGTWFVFVGRPDRPAERWQRTPRIIAGVGAAVSVLYLAIMAARITPVCAWCAAVHAVNLLMVILLRPLYGRRRVAQPAQEPSFAAPAAALATVPAARHAAHVVVFALILVVGLWLYRRDHIALGSHVQAMAPHKRLVNSLRRDPEFLLREHYAQPQHSIPARGTEDGPRVVVFTDFECSACYCAEIRLRDQIVPAFDGSVTIEFRHYPLCGECNPDVTGSPHPNACDAAYAAEAARLQAGDEAYHEMRTLLFEHRNGLGAAIYRSLAASIGLDVERFVEDANGQAVRRIVQNDIRLARELGIDETPAMFFNGRRVTAFGRDNPVFWQAVADDWTASRGHMHAEATR